MSLRRFVPLLLLLPLFACDNGSKPSTPPSSPTPPATPQPSENPCVAALAQTEPSDVAAAAREPSAKSLGYGPDQRDVAELLWRSAVGARAANRAAPATDALSQDVGDIAVIEDDGTLLLPKNALDLRSAGLRFERNGSGGYDVSPADATFRTPLGSRVILSDDDWSAQTIPFSFPYYGRSFTSFFLNSDGNLTFGEGDSASTERGFARLLGGPPRIAPFFSDLDPSTGGRVFVQAAADALTVTWCGVQAFGKTDTTTVQAVLFPSGIVDLKFGPTITVGEAIVGVSPGGGSGFTPVDLSAGGRRAGGGGAVGERFSDATELDTAQAAKRFFATHPDAFDQLVFWTDSTVVSDAFAFESTVSNAIRGIGTGTFNRSVDFGSGGTMQSLVVMDRVAKYGDDPNAKILGENSALTILGQETGHRWLAQLQFNTGSGNSDALLGRDKVHWSFFMDTDASVMEGNDIEDLGGGSFRTIAAVQRYSRLDQYAMGLVRPSDVPSFFYVDSPTNVAPAANRESGPRVGVTFNGTRRDVSIGDVIRAMGERQPTADNAPRLHRQAWIYVITRGSTPSQVDLTRLERMRVAWEQFFLRATENRMTLTTTLR